MKWQISIWNVSKQLMVLLSIWFRKGSDTCKLNFHRKSFLYYLPLRLLFFSPLVKWVFIWLYLVWGKSIAFKGSNPRLAHCFPLCGYGQTVCSRAEFANQRKTNLNGYQVHSYVGIYFYIFDYKSTYKLYFQSKIKRAKVKAGLWVGKAKFGNWTLSLNYGPHDKSS